jgi:hypothetical protein
VDHKYLIGVQDNGGFLFHPEECSRLSFAVYHNHKWSTVDGEGAGDVKGKRNTG